MIALKVLINGNDKFITGIEDWDSLHAVIMALRKDADDEDHIFDLKIGGLAQEVEPGKLEHVRWPNVDLGIGDEVSITIVDTDIADKPIKRYRSDKSVQENPFTEEELFELQKQDYLRLKELLKMKISPNKTLQQTADSGGCASTLNTNKGKNPLISSRGRKW